jgi:translocation and assembly module TamA
MSYAGGRLLVARMAAAALLSCHAGAHAQVSDPLGELDAPLDPSAPLDPMPDLDLPWPDLEETTSGEIADAPASIVAEAAAERRYRVAIEGLEEVDAAAITGQFDELSTLRAGQEESANAAQIDRRAREDAELLAELLRAAGYYDALVETRVAPAGGGGGLNVVLQAEPGPLYRFAEVRLPGIDEAGEDEAALRQAFGVEADDPVNAARVETGAAALQVALGERGYAFAEVGALDVTVDHESRTAVLVLPVNPGGSRVFGRILIEGTSPFDAEHVGTIARFDPGDPYRTALVEDLRRALIATGIVGSVNLRPVANEQTRAVDLIVGLEPAPMRTVAGEVGYGTGEGLRLQASWQHRNLIPPEGAVTFRGVAGTREQLLGASLRRNNFRRRDQVLTAQVAASHLNRDAYDARSFLMGVGLERQSNIVWQKQWTWSVGADLIATDERDVSIDLGTTRRRTFFIAALPGTLSYDGSNDLLDPTSGYRLSGRLSPELSLQGSAFGYAKAQVDGSFYHPASDRVTIAGRARFGTIFGASRDRIAPSRRFYAGGGGSVRGFGFQELGPRDPVFDDPIGGRSLAEFALEARIRVNALGDNLGIVPFIDAGNIYTSPLPDVTDLRFGAGVGIRYHTRFGPIRVDLGTPLDRRRGDPVVAVQVSLGQAF